jgi:hypothetical protein
MPAELDALLEDLAEQPFTRGLLYGRWSVVCLDDAKTVTAFVSTRKAAPRRLSLRLDISGYPAERPQGTFWDPWRGVALEPTYRPILHDSEAFKNWPSLYIACDRSGHQEWSGTHPMSRWRAEVGLACYLTVVADLLAASHFNVVWSEN